MTEKLQKILSRAGIASRRALEQMIDQGRVTVNGKWQLSVTDTKQMTF